MYSTTVVSASTVIDLSTVVLSAAQDERADLRRRHTPGSGERQERLVTALSSISGAMTSIRSVLGRAQWDTLLLTEEEEAEIRRLSKALQYERRQLKKMLR